MRLDYACPAFQDGEHKKFNLTSNFILHNSNIYQFWKYSTTSGISHHSSQSLMSVISRANALHSLVRPSSICLPTNGKICIKTPFCLFLLETFSWNHHSVTSHTTLLLIAGIWTELPVKYIEKQPWRYCQAWGPGLTLYRSTVKFN